MKKNNKLISVIATASVTVVSTVGVFDSSGDRISSSSNQNLINFNITQQPAFATDALAKGKSTIRFVPPNNSKTKLGMPGGRSPGASRGCSNQSEPVSLNLFAPQQIIGLTTSKHPTFFWQISTTTPANLKFVLVEQKLGGKTLFAKEMQVEKSGIIQLKVPQDKPELLLGQDYRWSVALICNNRPSTKIVSVAPIQRVALSSVQEGRIKSTNYEYDRALIYAELGLWYNALSELAQAHIKQPNNSEILSNLQALLQQGGVVNMTAQNWQGFNIQ